MSSSSVVKIAVNGGLGRMGRRLCVLACRVNSGLELVGCLEYSSHSYHGYLVHEVEPEILQNMKAENASSSSSSSSSSSHLKELRVQSCLSDLSSLPDVVIDFSSPVGTVKITKEAAELGIPVVIGTTGLTSDEEDEIKNQEILKKISLIHAMNYSLGVNILFQLSSQVAKALGDDFDIEIVEAHHNRKVDSPSGTAYGIIDSICEATGRTRQDVVNGRVGQVGTRRNREIGVHSIRMGNVVGEHSINYASDFERIELTHKAQDRDVFASGALRAAKWLIGRKPGLYSMQDVLFGKNE